MRPIDSTWLDLTASSGCCWPLSDVLDWIVLWLRLFQCESLLSVVMSIIYAPSSPSPSGLLLSSSSSSFSPRRRKCCRILLHSHYTYHHHHRWPAIYDTGMNWTWWTGLDAEEGQKLSEMCDIYYDRASAFNIIIILMQLNISLKDCWGHNLIFLPKCFDDLVNLCTDTWSTYIHVSWLMVIISVLLWLLRRIMHKISVSSSTTIHTAVKGRMNGCSLGVVDRHYTICA